MTPLVSHGSGTEEEGVATGGISTSGAAAAADALSSNAASSGVAQKRKGKTSEQEEEDEEPPTLDSILANHASLNVTNELDVHPPFASGELAEVHSGSCRKKKVLLDVILLSIC
jgi:hypothetical protein